MAHRLQPVRAPASALAVASLALFPPAGYLAGMIEAQRLGRPHPAE